METIKLWARDGAAVRQALELGELVHRETASEELTDEFLLFAIQSGLLSKWAEAFPDPRQGPEIGQLAQTTPFKSTRDRTPSPGLRAGPVIRPSHSVGRHAHRGGQRVAVAWAVRGQPFDLAAAIAALLNESGHPSESTTASAPLNASPAAIVSTTVPGNARTCSV